LRRLFESVGVLRRASLCVAGILCLGPTAAVAEDASSGKEWDYTASVYLWGAGIEGATTSGAQVDIGFDDLLENLNMAFMGSFEARRAEWSWMADVVYMDVGGSNSGTVPVNPGPGPGGSLDIAADVQVKGWVLSFLGGYALLQEDHRELDLVAGARYLDIATDFNAQFDLGPVSRPVSVSSNVAVWDGVIGLKGRSDLNRNWYATYHADVGAGQSDLTWQASAGIGYRFGWGDVSLVYRHMQWEFDSKDSLDDVSFSGPLLSAGFHF
jgi:hypothetical protein